MLRLGITFLLFCFVCFSSSAEKVELTVTGSLGTFEYYDHLVKEKGGDAKRIDDYASPYADRATISLLLLVQALHAGGLDFDLNLVPAPNPERSIRQVKQGRALVYQADIWQDGFDESTYMSEPIVEAGALEKGFYVPQGSPLLATDSCTVEQLRQLRVAVEKTWRVDIQQLAESGFNNVTRVSVASVILDMVHRQRVDAAFLEFPNNTDMSYVKDGQRYFPIPGYKVKLKLGRSFMVSKAHPDGAVVFTALNKGLAVLRQQGRIQQALRQAGLYQIRIDDWQVL